MERKEKSIIRRGAEIAFCKADVNVKKFMYKPSKALDEYVSTREKQINENNAAIKQTLEKKQAKKEAKKNKKKEKIKQNIKKKKKKKEAKKAEKEAEKAEFSWGFKKRDFEDNEEQPSRFHFNWFNKKNSKEEYELIFIDQIRDKDQKPFVKPLKGRELLSRDYKSTPLYIAAHDDYLKVIDAYQIDTVASGVVSLVLETRLESFLIEFPLDF